MVHPPVFQLIFNKPVKIIQIFPGKVWGGAEQYVLDLGRALASRGHEVTYIARDADAVTSRLEKSGIGFTTLPFRWALDMASIRKLAEEMMDADVVHVHDVMFAPLAVLAKHRSRSKARIVMTRHDAHRTPANIFYRPFIKQIHKAIFVSDLARRSWHGANRWFPTEKCSVVLNSIPPYGQRPMESLREKYSIAPSTPLLLFCGRIKKTKGCDVIIKALSLIRDKDFAMVFVGKCAKDSYCRKLHTLAEEGGISDRIHYYGFSEHGRQFFPQADIALAPSAGKDACLLSNIEAMQAGTCVISTDNGGQVEYISSGENGLLVPPSDAASLAEAIATMIDNPPYRERLAKAGQEYFLANMNYTQFVDKILADYR